MSEHKPITIAIEDPKFQKIWNIRKDLLDVCKDCEYRYMCVDPRVPMERKDKTYFYETECNYNPYIGKWKEEENYRSLKDSGIHVAAEGFKIDVDQLKKVNIEIWGEEQ